MPLWICLHCTGGTCCEAPQGGCFLVLHFKHVAEVCVGSWLPMSLQGDGWGDSEHLNISVACVLVNMSLA